METGKSESRDRVLSAALAVATAVILWAAVSHARPPDTILSAHEGIECAGCHMGGGGGGAGGGATGADRKCAGCHTDMAQASQLAAVFHGSSHRACTSCHSFHDPDEIRARGTSFVYEYGDASLQMMCGSCHRADGRLSKISTGHRDAADVYHVAAESLADLSPSESCLRCHSKDSATFGMPASASSAPRFHGEATHPLGERVVLGYATGGYLIRRTLDPRLPLLDDRIECQTCHALADDVEDRLVRFATKYDLCLGCHERHPSGGAPLAAATGPTASLPQGASALR